MEKIKVKLKLKKIEKLPNIHLKIFQMINLFMQKQKSYLKIKF